MQQSIPKPATGSQNRGCNYHEIVGPAAGGQQLLTYLCQRYQHSTPDEWTANINSGRVLLDGQPARVDHILKRGEEVVWQRPPWIEPDAPCHIERLYEDADLLAVAKPAGLPTLPGANFLDSTLLHLVQAQVPKAIPLHRLGRWTSGLVLCAKSPAARTELMRQWTAREVDKRYRALVSGLPPWDRLTIDTPIGPVPHPLLGTVYAAAAAGKPALSEVTVLERRTDCCLCDVRISTGRPHQIRIHLAAAGYPLLGDPLYTAGGLPAPDSTAVPGDPGYQLHAAELGFRHPSTGLPMRLTAEPPEQLRRSTAVA